MKLEFSKKEVNQIIGLIDLALRVQTSDNMSLALKLLPIRTKIDKSIEKEDNSNGNTDS